jgi:hypothetical protein
MQPFLTADRKGDRCLIKNFENLSAKCKIGYIFIVRTGKMEVQIWRKCKVAETQNELKLNIVLMGFWLGLCKKSIKLCKT